MQDLMGYSALLSRMLGMFLFIAITQPALCQAQAKVVLLGSGTPIPDPQSSGPAVAVVVNGQVYLFDAGAGVIRRVQAAAEKFGLPALDPSNLTKLFLTHLHSDHTLGYPDVILTPWVIGRSRPLDVYGPQGVASMTEHIKLAFAEDISVRTVGLEHLSTSGLQVNVHEFAESGPVYSDTNVRVQAIAVPHGSWKLAFGYLIETDGRRIVISGDTSPTDAIATACNGCDVLLHEVYSAERFAQLPRETRRYHAAFHTSTKELAELASKAKPKLLIMYHQLYFGEPSGVDLGGEVRRTYSGMVISGRDLSVY